jgi:hypothetical protein
MEKKELMDIYSDYLLASFRYTTSTGLSELTEGKISHDKITRFLRREYYTSKDLWRYIKHLLRQVESEEGILAVDDSIVEKEYTDENKIICWHWDHSKGRNVKGINFISALYINEAATIPLMYELIEKTETYIDKDTGKGKRRSKKSKNEIFRELVDRCLKNRIKCAYILADVWYASVENMRFVKVEKKHDFIFPIKSNRYIAANKANKLKGIWIQVEEFDLEPGIVKEIYLEGVGFPVRLIKQVFTNKDGSEGVQYLISSNLSLDYDDMISIYHKRWKIEEYHKSLKVNASLGKSPTKTVKTQSNHFFLSIWAYVKLEKMKLVLNKNHFAIKSLLYLNAVKASFNQILSINFA